MRGLNGTDQNHKHIAQRLIHQGSCNGRKSHKIEASGLDSPPQPNLPPLDSERSTHSDSSNRSATSASRRVEARMVFSTDSESLDIVFVVVPRELWRRIKDTRANSEIYTSMSS